MSRSVLVYVFVALLMLATGRAEEDTTAVTVEYNSDHVRRLGTPQINRCEFICARVGLREPDPRRAYSLESFCSSECQKCIEAVSVTKAGLKTPLPEACKTTFKLPPVFEVVNDVLQGKIAAAASVTSERKKVQRRPYVKPSSPAGSNQ